MQISSILSSLTDTIGRNKRHETAVGSEAPAVKTEAKTATNPTSQKAMIDVLKKYDVKQITPEEFSQMVQELKQSGALSEQEMQELSAIRMDLENAGIDNDESVNLMEFYSQQLKKAQQGMEDSMEAGTERQRLGPIMQRLDWVQKFAMIQENPNAVGLDLAA